MHRRMLERVQIKHVHHVIEADFELGPVTVFVGPNGAGKSTLFHVLDPFRPLPSSAPAEVNLLFADGAYFQREPGKANAELEARLRYQKLHLDPNALRRPNVPAHRGRLSPDGDNLTNVFAGMTRKTQAEVAAQFVELVPIFSDLDVEPFEGGTLRLRFHDRWDSTLFHSPEQVSDGALLLLAYLVLPHQAEPVDVVAIEEPEGGLHPYLIGELLSHLRRVSRGDGVKSPIQFLLATHSVSLLELARAEEVRFVDRKADTGATFVRTPPTDEDRWQQTRELYREAMHSAWVFGV
jgi:predicted ATPase